MLHTQAPALPSPGTVGVDRCDYPDLRSISLTDRNGPSLRWVGRISWFKALAERLTTAELFWKRRHTSLRSPTGTAAKRQLLYDDHEAGLVACRGAKLLQQAEPSSKNQQSLDHHIMMSLPPVAALAVLLRWFW